MPRVRLDQPINANGIDTTAAALLDAGRAIVQQWDNFGKNRVTKYVLVLLDAGGAQTDDYFEIGAKAYQSRAAKEQDKVQAQIDHLLHGLPYSCHGDYWYQEELARLQQTRSMLDKAAAYTTGRESNSDRKGRRRRERREDRWWLTAYKR